MAQVEADRSQGVVVEARGLRKIYRDQRQNQETVAISRLDLTLYEGEFVTILGPSGCGKSTFLFMVAGFEQQSTGDLEVDGRAVTAPGSDRGVVFQEYALFPWMTILDNVAYGLREKGMAQKEREKVAGRYIKLVGLSGFERCFPHQLSGGMRQRVSLARVLANNPRMLLMDEPFAALDEQTRVILQNELLRLWEAERKTVLFVTHSIDEAIFLADRVVIMTARPGQIKEVISVDLPRPRDRTSDEFNRIRRHVAHAIEEEVLAAHR